MFSFICDGNLKKAVWDGQRSLGRQYICDGNLKKAVWDGQRSLGRQCPFFLGVCVCLWGGGWAGWA